MSDDLNRHDSVPTPEAGTLTDTDAPPSLLEVWDTFWDVIGRAATSGWRATLRLCGQILLAGGVLIAVKLLIVLLTGH